MAFTGFLEENLLTLLIFDVQRSKIVRSTVDPIMFSGNNREIATRSYEYLDKYKKPPSDHIADLLEDKLTSDNKREARAFKDILAGLHDLKETINAEYVLNKLEDFVKRQSLRSVAVNLAKALQRDTEESLEEAEEIMRGVNTTSLKVFDHGLRMSEIDRALSFLTLENNAFPTGIPEFDRRGFGPTRKEMFLYIADAKTGKTWMMGHLAKIVVMNGLRCLHVSLEMSEEKIAQRYVQSFFAAAKRADPVLVQRFKKLKGGGFEFNEREVTPKLHLDDPSIRRKLVRKMLKFKGRILDNIIVKQFPTGKLTVNGLEAYLDNLEITQRFVPDLLIVDYPDLMDLGVSGSGQYRHGLAEVYKNLRGIAVARNMALAVPTQSNRAGSGAKFVGRKNVAEAYSKIADADVVLTYSQTDLEKKLHLARLAVVAGRNDEDNITVVLSQNYAMGQYVVDSVMMNSDYWGLVGAGNESSDYTDDDD
jgi:hypothetical protein